MSKRILIVDDSPTVRAMVRTTLAGAGYDVIEEENPVIVPFRVRREKIDLVLLDVQMPLLQGDKLAGLLRPQELSARVILYSTLPEDELETKARASGAHGFLHKTGDAAALVKRVREEIGPPNGA